MSDLGRLSDLDEFASSNLSLNRILTLQTIQLILACHKVYIE